MSIGINASFARKPDTGIGQVTINFLKSLRDNPEYKEFNFVLYLEEDINLSLPENFRKKIIKPRFYKRDDLMRKIWWEKFILPKEVENDECECFFTLYQSPTILNCKPKNKNGNTIKHIMLVHDIIPRIFPQYLNNFRKKIYWKLIEKGIAKSDKIISVSSKTEKDLIHKLQIDPKKITVSYIDVDPIYKDEISDQKVTEVLKKYELKKGYIYGGGGLEVRKNIEGLMRAYKGLLDNDTILNSEIPKLVISGKLMPKLVPLVTDVQSLCKGLGIEDRVKLLGFVPQEDLPALYKGSTMFVYPSFYEGFGLPVLEAMNMGKPVITSKKSSLPEVGGDSVLYCDPEDIDDIAMVIKNLLVNSHLKEELSKRSRKRAVNFSWEKFTNKLMNIIKNEIKK